MLASRDRGLTNKEVAVEQHRSVHTIKHTAHNAQLKLGARNIAEANWILRHPRPHGFLPDLRP